MKPCGSIMWGVLCFFWSSRFFELCGNGFIVGVYICLFICIYLFIFHLFISYIYIQCIHLHIRYIGGLLYVKATLQKAHDARDAYCESPNLSINSN